MIKDNKTNIYIDASNILISLRNDNYKPNVERFFVYLNDKFRPDHIFYFTPKYKKEEEINKIISNINKVNIIYKEIYNENSKLKTNCDVEIAFQIMKDVLIEKIKNIILVSGDGDFVSVLDYAKEKNINTRVIGGTKKSTARIIKARDYLRYFLLTDVKGLVDRI